MIRQQGWAHSVGELARGVAAIAVWLQDSNDTVVAASRITGLASKFGGKRLPMVIGVTWQAADDISAQPLTWHSTSATAELQK